MDLYLSPYTYRRYRVSGPLEPCAGSTGLQAETRSPWARTPWRRCPRPRTRGWGGAPARSPGRQAADCQYFKIIGCIVKHGQGGEGEMQPPAPPLWVKNKSSPLCHENGYPTHIKKSIVFSMVYPFFAQRNCIIFTVQIFFLFNAKKSPELMIIHEKTFEKSFFLCE